MKNNKPVYAQNKGFILISVVLTLTILATLAFMLSRQSAINAGGVVREHQPDTARYAAEAGFNHAVWQANAANCTGYTDLSSISLSQHSYSTTITPTTGSPVSIEAVGTHELGVSHTINRDQVKIYQFPTQQEVLQPDASSGIDTYLYEWKKTWNYGSSTTLWVRNNWANSLAYSLLNFDVSAIPAEAKIISATLELWQNTPSANGGVVGVHQISSDWIEGTKTGGIGAASWDDRDLGIAWISAGGDYSSTVSASTSIPAATVGWNQWDITGLVSGWVSDVASNQGFILTAESSNTYVEFNSSDSTDASLRPKLTISYTCECGQTCSQEPESTPSLWLATTNDVSSSGTPGLDAWTNGEVIELGDPNLALEPNTDGTFASILNLDNFAGDNNATVDAIHHVGSDITVGSTNSVDLLAGDILLSTANDETLTSNNSLFVKDNDVFIFRPDTTGDYSVGSFIFLLEGESIDGEPIVGLSLVEKDTTVGDGFLAKGQFIIALTNSRDVISFPADDVGPGTTSGSANEFIDGPSLSLGSEIRGMELAEEELIIGGHTIPAGSILLTLNNDDTGGVGDNLVPADSSDIFYLTVTQTGSSPVADATLLFEGADVNLDTSNEHLQALSLTNTGGAGGSGGTDYLDEFNAIAYDGSDGSIDWAATPWQEGVESDGVSSGRIQVVNDASWCASSSCLRLEGNGSTKNFTATRATDLSGVSSATLSFDYQRRNYYSCGTKIEISSDGGSNWVTLATYGSNGGDPSQQSASFDILTYATANTQTRFISYIWCDSSEYFYADNVSIVISGGGPPPPPGECNGIFRDEFNARNFSGSIIGTLDWTTDWVEVGESDGATSGDIQVRADQSNYQLRTRDNNNGGEGVEREADLSGATSATLSYDYRRMNLDNSSDYTAVEISTNGAAGPWTELTRHQGSGNDSSYQSASHDISAYIATNTRVRFKTSSNMGGTDTVWFDNIQIQCSP